MMGGSFGRELAEVSVTPAGANHAVYWPCETLFFKRYC
jgi:hypothetical protein